MSQGASLALGVGIFSMLPIRGIFLFSGFIPYQNKIKTILPGKIKIFILNFIFRGRLDKIVPFEEGTKMFHFLEENSYKVKFFDYQNAGHYNIVSQSYRKAAELFKKNFTSKRRENYKIQLPFIRTKITKTKDLVSF